MTTPTKTDYLSYILVGGGAYYLISSEMLKSVGLPAMLLVPISAAVGGALGLAAKELYNGDTIKFSDFTSPAFWTAVYTWILVTIVSYVKADLIPDSILGALAAIKSFAM
jgi:hypothetical protein